MVARRTGYLVAVAFIATALAGCLGSSVDRTSSQDDALTTAVPAFRYLCPGEEGAGSAGPCLAELPRGDANLQQPYVAIHPGNP